MVYKISLTNGLYGHLMPPEDSVFVAGKVFCVADGITRDPIFPKNFIGLSPEKILKKYPNPSGARLAADVFCESFIKSLNKTKPSKKAIKDAFILANKKIAQLNKKYIKKVDYLFNDFFACVASGGVISGNKLFWGGISDCGIIVYDKTGKVKFQTPNWMKDFQDYENKYLCKKDFNWPMVKYRKMIRSEYRNNTGKTFNNKCISYGALTGEKMAEYFMYFGEVELSKGDLVVFYSDGFEETVRHEKFFQTIYQKNESLIDQGFVPYSLSLAKKDSHRFGRERTLIAVIN